MSNDNEYTVDPYSAAVTDIAEALRKAEANKGAMSLEEWGILRKIRDHLFRADPHLQL